MTRTKKMTTSNRKMIRLQNQWGVVKGREIHRKLEKEENSEDEKQKRPSFLEYANSK